MTLANGSSRTGDTVPGTPDREASALQGPARRKGCHASVAPRLEVLEAVDVPDVLRLHREVYASLPERRVLYLRDGAFFDSLLAGGEGGIVGARVQGRLVGYAAFRRAGREPGSYYRRLDLPGVDPGQAAETAGSVVHPDLRGRGLHRALCRTRREIARSTGYQHMAAVVSVANPGGAVTCIRCGFAVRALHFDADGANLLLHTHLRRPAPPVELSVERWVELADIDGHRAALIRGQCGVSCRRADSALLIGYASHRADNPPTSAVEQSPSRAVS